MSLEEIIQHIVELLPPAWQYPETACARIILDGISYTTQGLRQLMAGSRKFNLEHIARDDIAALTHEAKEVSGIQYVMDVDQGKVERILDS